MGANIIFSSFSIVDPDGSAQILVGQIRSRRGKFGSGSRRPRNGSRHLSLGADPQDIRIHGICPRPFGQQHGVEGHRGPGFLSSRPNWVPHPLTRQGMLLLPPLGPGGETHSLAGGIQFRRKDRQSGTLCTLVYNPQKGQTDRKQCQMSLSKKVYL